MDRPQVKPQVKLSLLRIIFLKTRPLANKEEILGLEKRKINNFFTITCVIISVFENTYSALRGVHTVEQKVRFLLVSQFHHGIDIVHCIYRSTRLMNAASFQF
jgi:hypothetical protein